MSWLASPLPTTTKPKMVGPAEAEFEDGLLTFILPKMGTIPVKNIAVKSKVKKGRTEMIDLPTKAEVYCSDGIAGLSTYVIGNPINHQVTHLVVKSLKIPSHEYLVPVDEVEETSPHLIKLKCTRDEMEKMDPFADEEYLRTNIPSYLVWPYIVPDTSLYTANKEEVPVYVTVKHHNVPRGEIAVWRGAKVEATDGYIGLVDALLIDAKDMQATHLILLERHIFEQREISIPVSQIERVDEDTIFLKLDRKSVEALSTTLSSIWGKTNMNEHAL